ncbi:MAG: hypothetical protein KBF47_19625 [Gemmatimonadales bacterium]|nr:hypothetical protein [Gemmatimonadales bacterium]
MQHAVPAGIAVVLWTGALAPLAGQSATGVHLMGLGIASVTRVDPVPGGGRLTEGRLVQPLLMAHATLLGGRLRALGTLDLEGWTMPGGELTPGGWGEGFNDRRHPHTYAHELMVSAVDILGRRDGAARLSVSVGKGFAPFGSDDPMSRPTLRYPVNHHLAQVLERAVAIAGVRAGPVLLEGALFNGDEPERPGQWPKWDRFGDSWSARLTLLATPWLELSASRAKVHSPEHRPGAGTDAWKWHAAARVSREAGGGRLYALAEWARTEEADGFFVFRTVLAEAEWRRGPHRPYYRFERSDRPEDLRELDLFRSVRPHLENAILGTTRFTLHTLGYGFERRAGLGQLALQPFVEATFGRAQPTMGGVLTPEILYGTSRVRAVTAGLRLSWGLEGHRMGRYGGLLEPSTSHPMEAGHGH